MKYVWIGRLRAMGALVYDRDLVLRSAFMLVVLLTFVQLWTATYGAAGGATLAGFALRDLVWYLVITEIIALSPPRIAHVIDGEVRSGDVAYALGRPYNYPLYHLASFWGESLVRLPVNAAVGSAVALIAVGPPALSLGGLAATAVLVVGAITMKGTFELLVGLSAFWVEDTQPAEWLHNKLVITIGGLFLPLELFPDWLASIARALPFASMAYAPARTFVAFDWATFTPLLLTQATWLGLLWLTVLVVFARAARRVAAHGG